MPASLPEELFHLYLQQKGAIRSRLVEFSLVSQDEWFYELCFCLCTPQSSAVNALAVQQVLSTMGFLEYGQNVEDVLRDPSHYIRFHHTKHLRLHEARNNWPAINAVISAVDLTEHDRRDALAAMVKGIGMKEASHFLRNIGRRGLAILDRHLLANLVKCGLYQSNPSIMTIS